MKKFQKTAISSALSSLLVSTMHVEASEQARQTKPPDLSLSLSLSLSSREKQATAADGDHSMQLGGRA